MDSRKQIFFGGPILTINDDQPKAEAVGIEGENIVAVGGLEEVKNQLKEFDLISLEGKTLLPGFIDSHFHGITNLFLFIFLDLSEIKSLKEMQDLLKKTAKNKKPGEIVVGLKFCEDNFSDPSERVLPNRWNLDQAVFDKPVFILRYDGHVGVVNSKMIELAEINNNTEVIGGEILKKNGELTGVLYENATSLIFSKLSLPEPKEILGSASKAFKYLGKKGITSFHCFLELDTEGGVTNLGGIEISLLKTIKEEIFQDIYSMIFTANPKKIKRFKKPPLDDGRRFKVGGLKAWFDGSLGARTAFMFEPFSDQPEKSGFCVIEPDKLYERMKIAHNLGFQIAIHAIGDKANRTVVDLYKKLLTEFPRDDHRHRIEHASILTENVIKDIKALNLIVSCQPPFLNSEYTYLEKVVGKERIKYTYPYRSLLDAGVIMAAGSDGPVEDPDVIQGLHALVTRNNLIPEERISINEALKTYTINGAYAAFEENIKGSIEVGKLANFVILDKNPLEVSENQVKDLIVIETIIRGKTVYKK